MQRPSHVVCFTTGSSTPRHLLALHMLAGRWLSLAGSPVWPFRHPLIRQGSDCATVKKLYDENSEIAIHTVTHKRLDPSFAGGEDAMREEMFGVRAWLNTECGIPLEDLRGFRAPYLISNQMTRALLQKEGMLYDSSMISAFSRGSEVSEMAGQRPFPFTMDAGIPINAEWNYPDGHCNCSTESYPGMFELPMYELQNAAGEHLASMDPEGDALNIYRENFDMNYANNRAPFGVYLHAPVRALNLIDVYDRVADRPI